MVGRWVTLAVLVAAVIGFYAATLLHYGKGL